ncbi:MAG: hypothetical protein IJV72_02790 [Clostridia bacterium]|nr:hypothetical protein [Clostridia bacterium]
MKKIYTHPELEALDLNVLDVITASPLGELAPITPEQGGSDPSMEDEIDL